MRAILRRNRRKMCRLDARLGAGSAFVAPVCQIGRAASACASEDRKCYGMQMNGIL